jgi:hypothetical protein
MESTTNENEKTRDSMYCSSSVVRGRVRQVRVTSDE